MRLLFLTPQLPYPPRQGAALRNWGLIGGLAARHEVHLLSFGEADAPTPPGVASLMTVPLPVRRPADRLRTLVASAQPDMVQRLASHEMHEALARLLRQHRFDVVQVEGIEMVPFAEPYLGQRDGPRWVYDAHNAESDLQRSALRADLRRPRRWHAAAYSAVQVLKLGRYERRWFPRFDHVIAVSDEDATLLAPVVGHAPLVLPNGIDSEASAPEQFPAAPEVMSRAGPALLFTGKMDYRPNVDGILWFVDEVLPSVQSGPQPTLWIVGQSPHAALDRLRDHPQIVMTGWVEAVEPYLMAADVVVVPLRMGSGTRLKVLQALSLARPVVGTTLGCAGLGVTSGEQLVLADEATHFARAIDSLLADKGAATAMGQRGRSHVQEHFDWRVLLPRWEAMVAR